MRTRSTAESAVQHAIASTKSQKIRPLLTLLVATLLPSLLVFGVDELIGRVSGRWVFFLFAVFVSARWGGYASGIGATLLSTALVWWRFVPPREVILKPAGASYLLALSFVVMGILISALTRRLRGKSTENMWNRSFLEAILDHSPNGVVIKDLEGRYVVVNKGFEAITGINRESALQHTDSELFPCALAEVFQANDKTVRETRAPVLSEQDLEEDEGRSLLVSTYPLRDPSGSLFATGATLMDITQRKHAEEALQEAMEDLRTAQHVAHVGSWRWDFRTNRAKWSEELYRIFGIDTSESAVPIASPGLKLLTAESIDRLRAAIEKLRIDGEPYEVDIEFTRPDGSRRWCTARGEALRSPRGDIIGINGTAADITHIKEIERLRDEWTSIIAHDLRQPIGVISMASELIPDVQGKPDEREHELLERIHRATETLERMVADLLDMSLLDAHRLKLERGAIDLSALVRQVVMRIPDVANAHVNIHENAPLRPVFVDPVRIEQVIGNLLANGVKYGDPRGPIDIRMESAESGVAIAITNRGKGIEPDEIPTLFDRFTRAKDSRRSGAKGLGLGLYIAREIVEAHGGRIWVESVPGQNTTFNIALPVAAAAGQEAA